MPNSNILLKNLISLYIFCMPFTFGFAFSPTIFPSLLIGILIWIILFFKLIRGHADFSIKITHNSFVIMLFLAGVIFSYLLNGTSHAKSFNHTIAYLTSFSIFYLGILFAMDALPDRTLIFKNILATVAITCFLNGLFGCLEFTLKNFTSMDIDSLIPHGLEGGAEYDPLVLGLFIRARGFAVESGHFMFMQELLAPLTFYYLFYSGFCRWNQWIKILAAVIIPISMLLSGSVAGFVIFPAAFVISLFLRIGKTAAFLVAKYKNILKLLALLGIMTVVLNKALPVNEMISLAISQKMQSESYENRKEREGFFFREFPRLPLVNKIIGAGPAGTQILGFSRGGSILNLYLSVCFETGLLGILLLSIFIIQVLYRAVRIHESFGFFITFSLIAGIIHYYLIANYWYPWFWFVCALAMFYVIKKPEIPVKKNA